MCSRMLHQTIDSYFSSKDRELVKAGPAVKLTGRYEYESRIISSSA